MGSFLGKLVGAIIAVTLLVICPIICMACVNNLRTERLSWNYLELYTDIVADKGLVQAADYATFTNNLSATGVVWDIEVKVESIQALPATPAEGGVQTSYAVSYIWNSNNTADAPNFNGSKPGDIITVTCTPRTRTYSQAIVQTICGLNIKNSIITSSKMIRNGGGDPII